MFTLIYTDLQVTVSGKWKVWSGTHVEHQCQKVRNIYEYQVVHANNVSRRLHKKGKTSCLEQGTSWLGKGVGKELVTEYIFIFIYS